MHMFSDVNRKLATTLAPPRGQTYYCNSYGPGNQYYWDKEKRFSDHKTNLHNRQCSVAAEVWWWKQGNRCKAEQLRCACGGNVAASPFLRFYYSPKIDSSVSCFTSVFSTTLTACLFHWNTEKVLEGKKNPTCLSLSDQTGFLFCPYAWTLSTSQSFHQLWDIFIQLTKKKIWQRKY